MCSIFVKSSVSLIQSMAVCVCVCVDRLLIINNRDYFTINVSSLNTTQSAFALKGRELFEPFWRRPPKHHFPVVLSRLMMSRGLLGH